MDWADEMFKWLGQMVLWFAGAAGTAFAAFRFLGSKWIENKCATRMTRAGTIEREDSGTIYRTPKMLFGISTTIPLGIGYSCRLICSRNSRGSMM